MHVFNGWNITPSMWVEFVKLIPLASQPIWVGSVNLRVELGLTSYTLMDEVTPSK